MTSPARSVLCALCLAAGLGACAAEDSEEPLRSSAQTVAVTAHRDGVEGLSLDSTLAVAHSVYLTGDFAAAQEMFRTALERARTEGARAAEARALTWLGLAAWRLGEHEDARRYGEAGLELKLAEGFDSELFRSYNALGLLAYYENRYVDASGYLETALRSTNAGGAVGDYATARQNLALVQTEWGDYRAAREGFVAFRDTMLEFGHRFDPADRARRLGAALTNLGMLEVRVGNPAAAVDWLLQAVDVYRSDYPAGEGLSLGHLATAYSLLGEQSRAFAVLDTALQQVRAQGLLQEEASNLEVLAEQYREAGDFGRALDLYEQAKVINERLNLDVETGSDLRGEAEIHLRLGAPTRALDAAREALVLHQDAGAPLEQLYDHLTLAEINHRLGHTEASFEHLSRSRRLADELAVRSATVSVAITEARLAGLRGDHRLVLETLGRASVEIERGGYAEQWQSGHLLAQAHRALGALDSAAAAGWRSLATVERVRGSYGAGVLRTSFAADKREVYAELMGVLTELGRPDDAFTVSDAARGRALREGLMAAGGQNADPTSSGELRLREIDGVLESIDLIETGVTAVDPETDAQALTELYERVEELRRGYESSLLRGVGDAPSETGTTRRVDARDVSRALADGEILIEYFVPPEGAISILVVDRRGTHVLEAPLWSNNLRSRVRLARDLMARPDRPEAARRTLEGLHEALIRPVRDAGLLEAANALVVIPHDALSYLPLGALPDPATGRLLLEDYELRVMPTAQGLVALRRSAPTVPDPLPVTVLAPLPAELPATEREALAIRSGSKSARAWIGQRATEQRLRDALADEGVVHVASHGIMNGRNPMFSRIELSPGSGASSTDDGRLEVHEILSLRARAALVFLSGCETGLGRAGSTRFAAGEDYTTLAQAFLRAGVRNVVATLWRVEDEAAARFATHFYEALKKAPPAAALGAAQRLMRTDPGYAAPYYWAGYQLLGDGSRIRLAQ